MVISILKLRSLYRIIVTNSDVVKLNIFTGKRMSFYYKPDFSLPFFTGGDVIAAAGEENFYY